MPRFFDLLIVDEQHEYKARGSAQWLAAGTLAEACGRVLTLTGTLMGGYASTLFHLLWRFSPAVREEFTYSDESRWVARYGIVERITKKGGDDDAVEDGDGMPNGLETLAGSDPLKASGQPEFLGFGNSCGDGIDNDGDGQMDSADTGCTDGDGDTVPDLVDNCPQVKGINVLDSDGDGKGDICDPPHVSGDVDCNGGVGVDDLLGLLRSDIGLAVSQTQPCDNIGYGIPVNGDVDCSGGTNLIDLLDVAKSWQLYTSIYRKVVGPSAAKPGRQRSLCPVPSICMRSVVVSQMA
jgi:hypothetical protein